MIEHKLTDEEVVKALECCSRTSTTAACEGCPFGKKHDCIDEGFGILNQALALVKKQKAEIDNFKVINKLLESDVADRDEMLKQKVEVVYADFMKDYQCINEELEGLYDEYAEQKKEIERLEAYNANLRSANAHALGTLQDEVEKARASARDELCDALKERVRGIYLDESTLSEIIDELKEDLE